MYLISAEGETQKVNSTSFFINSENQARWIEWDLIRWCIENFAKPNSTFIDIGAHIGTYAWSLAPHVEKTWAFECNPDVYNCLCANIFLKGLSNKINAQKVGLSSQPGVAEYYIRSSDGGGNGLTFLSDADHDRKKLRVELRTLDSYEIQDVGFIKIDVEGHEKEVLQGAVETLRRNNNPPFIFESWKAGWTGRPAHAAELRAELFDYVQTLGYKVLDIRGCPEMFLAVHD